MDKLKHLITKNAQDIIKISLNMLPVFIIAIPLTILLSFSTEPDDLTTKFTNIMCNIYIIISALLVLAIIVSFFMIRIERRNKKKRQEKRKIVAMILSKMQRQCDNVQESTINKDFGFESITNIFEKLINALIIVMCIGPFVIIPAFLCRNMWRPVTKIGLSIYTAVFVLLIIAIITCLVLACIQEQKEKKEQEKREIVNLILLEMQRWYHSEQKERPSNNNNFEDDARARRAYKQTALVRRRLVNSQTETKQERTIHYETPTHNYTCNRTSRTHRDSNHRACRNRYCQRRDLYPPESSGR